ncbi:MAG TPA: allophanate hydrolase [Candidatus Binatia bacterium]|nr:allophanate hydrolase [Candidatus Binatia bacterium]
MTDLTDIAALSTSLQSGRITPQQIVDDVLDAIELSRRPEAWIHVLGRDSLQARISELEAHGPQGLPLYGVPFAVKDNIDVAGLPTTAGCPAYSYVADRTALAVERLLAAGAILLGKTHMDQFATGLVGTRSPHGPCRNAHAAEYIAGGSSSGSAVVVAQGLVSFALGTDTAGSGRVPAVLNGVVGLKPTRGAVSTAGVVPACPSLDCVSVFARTCGEAERVFAVMREPRSPGARTGVRGGASRGNEAPATFRFGIPTPTELAPLDIEAHSLFAAAVQAFERCGGVAVEIEYAPFRETADLLYSRGAWLVERDRAFGSFLRAHPDAVDPAVAAIVADSASITSAQVEASLQKLEQQKRATAPIRKSVDVLLVPTVPQLFRIAEVMARPLEASPKIGVFNNFANLLGMAALAVPSGAWSVGVPFGVTICGGPDSEALLVALGSRLEKEVAAAVPRLRPPARIAIAVVGAHLSGMPLHHQLASRGARLEARTRTSADYRLFALAGVSPPKPGLRRVASGGACIEVEVWSLSPQAFGSFVAEVPRPLAIGKLTLEDGSQVSGFVCETEALAGAEDITAYGGWRAYVVR